MRDRLKVVMLIFVMSFSAAVSASGTAPDFELDGLKGKVKLSEYKGNVVYLDFWASWCGPCRKSFPWMNDLQARFKDQGLRIVAVNLDSKRADADDFITQMAPRFDIAFDPPGNVAGRYDLQGMPSAFLIDRKGQLHSVHLGFRGKDIDLLEHEIETLLNNDKIKN